MAKVRGEFIRLGNGPSYGGGGWPNVLEGRPVDNFTISPTGTATTVENRIIVPTFTQDGGRNSSVRGHVRLIPDSDMYVEVFDPNDSDFASAVVAPTRDHAFFMPAGVEQVIPVKTGQGLGFITGAI